ncbi:MAG TPA: prolyl oligopeptidase family serine peptidase [Pseudonocardiaceae bacterium]|jgi:dipeptidyl-peptidase-4|nr:prolyl oligopeptidase family serine peptidase [Pseudonocardiaceae bacterium]
MPVTSNETSFLRLQARTQRFTLGTPREIRVTPDGARVLFLRSASGTDPRHSLWSLDIASGRETRLVDPADLFGGHEELSAEERAARERTRTQAGGIVAYTTDDDYRVAAFSLSGKLFVVDLVAGGTREVPVTGSIMDPRLDPTGTRIAYASDGALRIVEVDGSGDRALVESEDPENVAWGIAEFLAAEEMERVRGYWWSPSGDRILAARTDRSAVRRWYIADPANPDRAPNKVAYPAAGTDNVRVSLAVFGLDAGRVDVDWDGVELPYLTSVHWSDAGDPLIAVQTRDQRRVVVSAVDVSSGATTVRQELTDPHWVDVVPGAPAWTPDGRLVTVGARDGAYRLFADGVAVTGTDLNVRAVLDVGPDDVLFTASADDPTQVHVYTVGSGEPVRVSTADGVHSAVRSGSVLVLVSWGLEFAGPVVTVFRDGKPGGEIASLAVTPPLTPQVTMLTVGERGLRCALVFPTGYEAGSGKLPVLLDPYGGPHAQRVLRASNSYLTPQWLADQGFAVLIADGRGTPGRGPGWDRAVAFDLIDVTLADQVDALHAVAELYPDLDLGKVAIRGWSYGGYLAAAAVLRRPDVVHAALSGAPVTDPRLYDTHYMERYLGHPDEHPDVYERNSLIGDAAGLRRPLMLIHGLADDNVFVAHTLRLSAALLAAGREHVVLPVTGATHMGPRDEQEAESFMLLQIEWLKRSLGL